MKSCVAVRLVDAVQDTVLQTLILLILHEAQDVAQALSASALHSRNERRLPVGCAYIERNLLVVHHVKHDELVVLPYLVEKVIDILLKHIGFHDGVSSAAGASHDDVETKNFIFIDI